MQAPSSLGNFINGAFVPARGSSLVSRNPAADGAVVFETTYAVEPVRDAVRAAAAAQPAWAALTQGQRALRLDAFKAALAARADGLADAIVLETGKLRSEAKVEVTTVLNRFDAVKGAMAADLHPGAVAPGEVLRYQALGVVGVIGPWNYPVFTP
ncbi:MAG: aldehyde dehydrogenase family protein, partial [Proteobacteria bacterium]|nr:aldehyde dehydrogenase family protein [Pseudomonadota bacterium]